MVIEDKVRGANINNTWNQLNYYSSQYQTGGVPGHPLYDKPAYMVGYFHNHVVRSIPSTAWGNSGIIPAVVTPGESYTKVYTYTLPAITTVNYGTLPVVNDELYSTEAGFGMNKPADVTLIGFVSLYDADITKRTILNSGKEPLFNLATGVKEANEVEAAKVYPNPSNGLTYVSFNVK